MSHEPGDPGLPPGETRAAGALLSAAWGEPVAVLAAEALRDRPHVFRLRLDGGRSAVLKRARWPIRCWPARRRPPKGSTPTWSPTGPRGPARLEDDSWGTTTMRPRLLAWLRSF